VKNLCLNVNIAFHHEFHINNTGVSFSKFSRLASFDSQIENLEETKSAQNLEMTFANVIILIGSSFIIILKL